MRRVLLLLLSVVAVGQATTPNLGLNLPAQNQLGWNALINQNFSIIDSALGGNGGLSALKVSNAGVFTNTQMNDYLTSVINGCSTLTEFQATQGNSNYATEAVSGCVAYPNGATVHQANGVAGYANSTNSTVLTGGAVGGYFSGRQLVNSGASWGINSIVMDTSGVSGDQLASNETDVNFAGSPARVWGIIITGASTGTTPSGIGNAAGLDIRAPGYAGGSVVKWNASIDVETNSFSTVGINVGTPPSSAVSMKMTPVAFSTLPACSSGNEGMIQSISDSTTATYNATITGGGTNHLIAYCNGTNWTAH